MDQDARGDEQHRDGQPLQSAHENAEGYLLTRSSMEQYVGYYLADPADCAAATMFGIKSARRFSKTRESKTLFCGQGESAIRYHVAYPVAPSIFLLHP